MYIFLNPNIQSILNYKRNAFGKFEVYSSKNEGEDILLVNF